MDGNESPPSSKQGFKVKETFLEKILQVLANYRNSMTKNQSFIVLWVIKMNHNCGCIYTTQNTLLSL